MDFLTYLIFLNMPKLLIHQQIHIQQSGYYDLYGRKSLTLHLLRQDSYYNLSIAYGYKFTVSLTLNDEGCEQIIAKNQKELESFTKELKNVNKFEVYEQFVDYLNDMSQKAEKSCISTNSKKQNLCKF